MRALVLAIALFLVAPAAASAAPTVTLDKPGPGAVAGTIAVAATATGAARVEFSVNGEVKLIDHSAPYGGSFDTETVADGSAQITATAFGGGGLSASSSVTVTTGAQKAAPAPQILVSLGFSFTSNRRATKLANFLVKHVPAGATVTVKCPKGCARKAFKKARVRGRLLLKPLVSRPLKRGTEITVVVSKPGFSSAVKVLTIRARKAPLVTTLCLPEGSSKPAAC